MAIKFTDYVPITLVNVNSASKTLAAETTTGLPIPTGAVPGASFYIGPKDALLLGTAANPVYEGWYRVVQVDAGATAANVAYGTIGALVSGAGVASVAVVLGTGPVNGTYVINATSGAGQITVVVAAGALSSATVTNPGTYVTAPTFTPPAGLGTGATITPTLTTVVPGSINTVTSYDQAYGTGFTPIVFLGAVTPGYYTFVQEAGDAPVSVTATTAVGNVLTAATGGNGIATPQAGGTTVTFTLLASVIGVASTARTGAGLVRARLGFPFGGPLA